MFYLLSPVASFPASNLSVISNTEEDNRYSFVRRIVATEIIPRVRSMHRKFILLVETQEVSFIEIYFYFYF